MDGIIYAKGAAYIAAALAIGIGCIAPAIGQGLVGSQACKSIGENPEMAGKIRILALMSMAIIETGVIAAACVAGAIIYFGGY